MFQITLAQRTRMFREENIQEAMLLRSRGRHRGDLCSHDEHRLFRLGD